jgi:AcrR family transcriptional regulator
LVLALKAQRSGRVPQRTSPRKAPNQQRSRDTVEAILRATARILVEEGYEGTTTNRVAEVAGVSVGSLYQYFPGKESLVAALIDRHMDEVAATLSPGPEVLTLPLERLARLLVEALLRAHAVDPKLHKVLVEVGPRLGKHPHRVRDTGVALVKGLMQLHQARMRKLDPDLTAFIVVTSVEKLCHEALLTRPDLLESPKLVDEMTELLLRFVRK